MAPAKVVSLSKGPGKTLPSTSLKANIPNRKIGARKFGDIPSSVDSHEPEHLQESDNASIELLKVGSELQVLGVGYRKRVRARVASIYGIALFLKADEAAWVQFAKHKQWKGVKNSPQFEDQNDALRYALRFAVGLKSDAASKRASKYYRALVSWFEKNIPAQEVMTKIKKHGGFDSLARVHAEKSKAKISPKLNQVTTKGVERGAAKKEVLSALQKADFKQMPPDEVGKGQTIGIVVEANKNTELLLKAKKAERLKMTFSVESVHGRVVSISDARAKLTPKKRKKVTS